MTSLNYGTWNNTSEKPSKKRTATYDKPSKQSVSTVSAAPNNSSFSSAYDTQPLLDANDLELNTQNTTTEINQYITSTEKNQSEIHDLLDQMNQENFENNNAPNLNPIPPPQLISKKEISTMPSSGEYISNYQTIYNKGTTYTPTQGQGKQPIFENYSSKNDNNAALLEKLNYMIYLLEQQQNEKTNYILEEFVLYCFVGIFMIYIVDGFARSGNHSTMTRYTR